jgi:hypothetical protein
MTVDRDVVCLSSQDWSQVWTRKQRFMQRLARRGSRVLYVNLQVSWASLGYLKADWRRPFRWMSGPQQIEPNLFVATLPLALPGVQMSRRINALNNAFMAPIIRRWLRGLGFTRPVLWTYTPHSENLVGRLGESCVVYECVDEFAASRGLVRADVVREQERRLIASADTRTCIGPRRHARREFTSSRMPLMWSTSRAHPTCLRRLRQNSRRSRVQSSA